MGNGLGVYQADGGSPVQIGGNLTNPVAINNSNIITGETSLPFSQTRAFIQPVGGAKTILPVPAGSQTTRGRDINDAGVVLLNTFNNQLNTTGPYTWTSSTGLTKLPTNVGVGPLMGSAINDLGWVVGSAGGATGVLWRPGQAPLDLTQFVQQTLGRPEITIVSAEDVNDVGQIVGMARIDGVSQAYRLTIPSPNAGIAAAIALGLLRRRRRSGNRQATTPVCADCLSRAVEDCLPQTARRDIWSLFVK